MISTIKKMRELMLGIIIILLSLIITTVYPKFFGLENSMDILKSNAVLGIASLGMLLILLVGQLDISISSVIAMTTVLTGLFMVHVSKNVILGFVASCIIGTVLSGFNGFLIVKFNLPSIVVTLGMLHILFGLMIWMTNGNWITNLPEDIWIIGRIKMFPIVVFFVIALLIALLLRYTFIGRGILAVGGNKEAARRIGFSISFITLFAFLVEGFISGIAAFVHTTIVNQVDPNAFIGFELQVIAVVILGGASIHGGLGSVLGVVLGTILMGTINNGLILMKIPTFWQKCIVGIIILLTVIIDEINKRMADSRTPKIDVEEFA